MIERAALSCRSMAQAGTRLRLLAVALVATSWMACHAPERPAETGHAEPGIPEEESRAAAVETPEPVGAVAPVPTQPTAPAREATAPVPLEKLLRLPASPRDDPQAERARKASPPSPDEPPSTRKSVRVEVGASQDVPMVRPDRSTDRVDVGVSVPVGESTRVRAGVRGERDAGEATLEADRTPTLGIEKRF